MTMKWRSAVTTSYKRRCVLRASVGGGLGVALLVGAGTFMPVSSLEVWGLPIFIAAGALITWSMLPYRRLCRLENNPDELWLNSKGDIVYAKAGSPLFTIPQQSIDKMFYLGKPHIYGICITVKPHPPEKIRLHNQGIDYAAMQHANILAYGCDIFLPFFTERTYKDLTNLTE